MCPGGGVPHCVVFLEGVEMANWKIDEAAAAELDGMGMEWK